MPLDRLLLREHRTYVDRSAGIREELLSVRLGGGSTVAVLTEPLESKRPDGWVMCHSFGIERINLHRLEVLAARALATAGFPVLRFDTPGYGDSVPRGQLVRLACHVEAARDAVSLLAVRPGIESVGVIGARLGALVACLVAEASQLRMLGLWQPFAEGGAYLDAFVTTARFTRMIERGRERRAHVDLHEDLRTKGWSDLNGFVLTREAWGEISALDVRKMRAFQGRALVIGVSETGTLSAQASIVQRHLQECGADCSTAVVSEEGAGLFGQHPFQRLADGTGERDALQKVFTAVTGLTTNWALGLPLEHPDARAS